MTPVLTYPWALLLLLVAPVVVWRYARRSSGAWQFADRRLLPSIPGFRVRAAWWGGLLLRVGALFSAILALSGPRWIDESARIPTQGISIAMLVDVSASMGEKGEKDFEWDNEKMTRLSGVKKVFRLFVAGGKTPDGSILPGRPHDMIALVTFGTHADTACPLTLDHGALLEIMERTEAEGETTNPGDGIAWALHVLQQAPTRRKVLVFLTDGESNVPDKLKPRQAAQLAANLSIPIYTIDASPASKNAEDAIEVKRAREIMQAIAKMTGGISFRAQDGLGLLQAYERIDRLERERLLSFQYRRYYEGFHWFALAALVCCLMVIALEATVWRKVP